jgi:hypothetical protein
MSRKQSNDERCLRRLIKRATIRRNWMLLHLLLAELGNLLEEEDRERNGDGDLRASDEPDGVPGPTRP